MGQSGMLIPLPPFAADSPRDIQFPVGTGFLPGHCCDGEVRMVPWTTDVARGGPGSSSATHQWSLHVTLSWTTGAFVFLLGSEAACFGLDHQRSEPPLEDGTGQDGVRRLKLPKRPQEMGHVEDWGRKGETSPKMSASPLYSVSPLCYPDPTSSSAMCSPFCIPWSPARRRKAGF